MPLGARARHFTYPCLHTQPSEKVAPSLQTCEQLQSNRLHQSDSNFGSLVRFSCACSRTPYTLLQNRPTARCQLRRIDEHRPIARR